MSGQTLNNAYIPLPGSATLVQNSAQKVFWHKDWLGTVRFGSFIGRSPKLDRAFAPYGEMYATVIGATANPDFTGDTQDVISGLFDTPARELHPTQGRWISPDPARAGWNPYAYMENKPLTGTDPTGLDGILGDPWSICVGLQESGSECDSHYMPPQLADGYHFGNPNFAHFGILPGEQSLNLPMPSLPPDVAAAIGAALRGDWRGLLDSAVGAASRDLWSMVPNPMIMDLNKDWSASETCNHFLSPAFNSATAGPFQGLLNIGHNSKGVGPYDFSYHSEYDGDTFAVNGVKMTPAQFSNYMAGFQAAAYDAKYKTGQLAEDAAEDMAVSYHPKGPYPFGLPWVYRGEQYGQWFGSWGGCR